MISEISKFQPNAQLWRPPIGHIACHASWCHNHDFMQIVPLAVLKITRVAGLVRMFQPGFPGARFGHRIGSVHHDYRGVHYLAARSSGIHHQRSRRNGKCHASTHNTAFSHSARASPSSVTREAVIAGLHKASSVFGKGDTSPVQDPQAVRTQEDRRRRG